MKIFLILVLILNFVSYSQTNNLIKIRGFNIYLPIATYISEEIISNNITKTQKIVPQVSIKKITEPEKKEEAKKELATDEESILYNNGIEFFKMKSFTAAEQSFIELLQKYPDTRYKDKATYYLGEIMLNQNRLDEALMYFNKINQEFLASPVLPDSLYKSALINFNKNNFDEALKILMTLKRKYPKNSKSAASLVLMGDIYRKKKEFNNSIKMYLTVLKEYGNSDYVDDAIFKLADIYENEPEIRNLEIAKNYYEKIVNSYPDSEYYLKASEQLEFIKKNFLEYK